MSLRRTAHFLTSALLVCLLPAAAAGPAHIHGAAQPSREEMWQAKLAAQQTLAVTVTFDSQGRLWRARVKEGHLLVDRSGDRGASFSEPVTVNPEKEIVAAEGDARPKIAVAADGAIYITYTRLLAKPFSGDIRFSRSFDGGKSYSPPVTVNDDRDIIGHRFDALLLDSEGRVHILWLDKRDEVAAKKKGEAYAGAALYHAVSQDRGASFAANVKLADHACECCRIAVSLAADGTPVAFWRHVFEGNERDHALMKLDGKSALLRVTHDRWKIDACPHHGPAMAADGEGGYHLAWFDNAPGARGLFYARARDGGVGLSPPLAFGDPAAQAGHPDVLSRRRDVFLVWKEFNGEQSVIRLQQSRDGGASWSAPRTVAETADASDYPQLVSHGGQVLLSWNTAREAYRLILVSGAGS